MTTLHSTRFGRLEVPAEAVIEFPNGLIGLGGTQWALLARSEDSAFIWLHSIDDPELAIPVTQPVALLRATTRSSSPTRRPRASGSTDAEQTSVYVTVRAAEALEDFTANLRAPILIAQRPGPPGHQPGADDYPMRAPALREPRDRGRLMLIITRRPGEKIMLGDDVVVEVIEVSGSNVRIGIAAPKSVPVYREEIWTAVKEENAAAARLLRRRSCRGSARPAPPASSRQPPVVPH